MGLCKCPKKRVTQHFCFEHRVNVCEFCMINGHPSCIVQPYIQWLEDSSFKSKCSLCQNELKNQDCVRLLCYHVFHWSCFNKYGENFSSNTAPAGFTCPDCQAAIFPSSNLPSPIFTLLRKRLANIEWAKMGLGLAILNHKTNKPNTANGSASTSGINEFSNQNSSPLEQTGTVTPNIKIHQASSLSEIPSSSLPLPVSPISSYVGLPSTDSIPYTDTSFISKNNSSRKSLDTSYLIESQRLVMDVDENKYRQKSTYEKMSRYVRNRRLTDFRFFGLRRWLMLAMILFFSVFVLFYMLIKLGRESADNDPLLDPRFNPNIHNQESNGFR